VGLPEVIAVASDSGMMGGKIAHEFMLLTPVGEDSVVTCNNCDYSANLDAAECIVKNENTSPAQQLTKAYTPNKKTIDDVCEYLKLPIEKSCKAVVYQIVDSGKQSATCGELVVVFIRGDLEVSETKLKNYLCKEIQPAAPNEDSKLSIGYIGPVDLDGAAVLFDSSLKENNNLCCGANEVDYHYTGMNIERDCGCVKHHDFAKATENGLCPQCNMSSLKISRGIEVGNIFQLGDKYTKSMDMSYSDENGILRYPLMGCYGIGVGRLAASVCEAHHDDFGPIWPLSIAPWQVHICCVRADNNDVKALADELYERFLELSIEVLYDDRVVSAGIMFSDADLLGIPIRVISSPRNVSDGCCEVITRDKSYKEKVPIEDVLSTVLGLMQKMK
jgi:prolyl-tRNA synthetase